MSRPATLLLLAVLVGCTAIRLDRPLGEPVSDPPAFPIEQVWERDVQAAFGPAAPYVTDRYVVVGTRRGEVVILDREDGRTAAVGEFGMSVEGPLAVSASGTVLYVPTADARGGVEAFDVRMGRRVWRWRESGSQAGVALANGVVVAPLVDGRVVGLDEATGQVAWTQEARGEARVFAAPVALDGDVVVADDRGRVSRIDVQTGQDRWAVEVGGPVEATPSADGASVVVSTTRGAVVRLDPSDGRVLWSLPPPAGRDLRASSASVRGDALAVGFTDGTARVLDLATGAERWRFSTDGNVAAPPLWLGAHVAVGTMDERLVLLDAETGALVWSTELRGRVKSALGVGGGTLVVLSEPRHVVAFHAAP